MKFLLMPLTVLTIALTGVSMQQAGWLYPAATRHVQAGRAAPTSTSYDADALYRHRSGQPSHWRAFVMNK